MGRQRDLELIIGSLEMRIATMETLWQEGERPDVCAELEDLLDKCKRYQDFGYKEQFRDLIDGLEEEKQGGMLSLLVSEVLAEYGDDTLKWCEHNIAYQRAKIKSREMAYKENLCESENI
jgi:hypothetical protein